MIVPNHRALVDTNILVYAHDIREPTKRSLARALLNKLHEKQLGVLSVQVLNEFYAVITRPRRGITLSHGNAQQLVRDLVLAWDILPLTSTISLHAIGNLERYSLSFWDALIWATAGANGLRCVYSEDFQHGREIEGVLFINPFVTATEQDA